MEKTIITALKEERIDGNVEKTFLVDDQKVTGIVDRLSLNPLRFLEYQLIQKGCKIKQLVEGGDPWNVQ